MIYNKCIQKQEELQNVFLKSNIIYFPSKKYLEPAWESTYGTLR